MVLILPVEEEKARSNFHVLYNTQISMCGSLG